MIYVTGDMHGNPIRFKVKQLKKLKKDDNLIICGDFGFIWEETSYEKRLLKKIGKLKFNTLFVDGTHENFDLLNKYETVDFKEGRAKNISGNLYQLLRGEIYKIDGKTIFTFGGGESPDKEIRAQSNKWWETELPCIAEMKKGVNNLCKYNRQVDYIISHEPPGKIKSLIYGNDFNVNILNRFLDDVAKEVSFKAWYFGSTHINKKLTQKYNAIFDEIISLD
ncbi:MAG: hypothetical protein RUMPE_00423 [Eubacteriales bacterium SKADARSKE-1]|nr:hypothetical protein [Eubacteriales bacterium SKADARSKE-1]